MAELQGLTSLLRKLEALKAKYQNAPTVIVSYSQEYAIYVHEDMEAKHTVGQAKFLEEPARTKAPEIAAIVAEALSQKKTPAQALLLGGLYLQAESQKLCPVDTGALKSSANTRIED